MSSKPHHDAVLIVDFGSQYSHLICRRIRELNVYCELVSCITKFEDYFKNLNRESVKGIILSGGPSSVYEEESPHAIPEIFESGLPVLGICYGAQEIAHRFGGKVMAGAKREFGHAELNAVATGVTGTSPLLRDIPDHSVVWMSHGDKVTELPEGFSVVATTDNSEFAAYGSEEKKIYGLQFHPEVTHSKCGKQLLKNFAVGICGCGQDWSMGSFVEESIQKIRDQVGPTAHCIGAVSGGVDSTVAAVLLNRALGPRFHAFFIDNGLLRLNESEEVRKRLVEDEGIDLSIVDASEKFLTALDGVMDPEQKRKRIGNIFIDVFEQEAARITQRVHSQAMTGSTTTATEAGEIEYLLQGTLYPDVIESISFRGPSQTIKTHHNVGGLKENMKLKLIEPLRELFKDEVRALGRVLGIQEESISRHPFPGPGLAIRIPGAVTREQLEILKHADSIYLEEIRKAGIYDEIGQAFAVLLPVKSVGVMGDCRTYSQVISLRAVQTTDFMTAEAYPMPWDVLKRMSTRIINEVKGVNRVVYDVSSKPPATIEWE